MPTGFAEQADGREWDGDDVDIRWLDVRLFQAELSRLVRHAVLCVFVAHEALFLGSGDQLAIDIEGRGGIMAKGAGQAKDRQCQRSSLFNRGIGACGKAAGS